MLRAFQSREASGDFISNALRPSHSSVGALYVVMHYAHSTSLDNYTSRCTRNAAARYQAEITLRLLFAVAVQITDGAAPTPAGIVLQLVQSRMVVYLCHYSGVSLTRIAVVCARRRSRWLLSQTIPRRAEITIVCSHHTCAGGRSTSWRLPGDNETTPFSSQDERIWIRVRQAACASISATKEHRGGYSRGMALPYWYDWPAGAVSALNVGSAISSCCRR
jgi:hypothetical protein